MLISTSGAENLKEGFQNPGFEARPRVWWHWMNGNITPDGIRKDLEWMLRVGIGGVHNFDAGFGWKTDHKERHDAPCARA